MDGEKKYWFPAKTFGWGWGLPCAWQGWVVFLSFLALVGLAAMRFPPATEEAGFTVCLMILIALFVLICWLKGEPPRWRWGGR